MLALILADPELSPFKRRAMASGLRSFSKAVQVPLTDLPTRLDDLRTLMKRTTPAMVGMSPERFKNCLSQTRRALTHVGVIKMAARGLKPFAPAWAALFVPLTEKHARIGLSRFARYCTERGIAPAQVTDAELDAFLVVMTEDSLIKRPRIVHQITIRIWNRNAGTTPGWPTQQLRVPSYSRTYTLPWNRYPISLEQEVTAYLAHLAGENDLEDLDFEPLRPASIRTRTFQLRAYLAALVHSGIDPLSLQSLADVVTLDKAKTGVRFFKDRALDKSTKQAHDVAGLVLSIGRHWVELEDDAVAALRKLVARQKPKIKGLTPKNRSRLRQFDDPKNVGRLLALPAELVALAGKRKHPTPADALLVQTALAIELLSMEPIRRGNLARLEIGRHVLRARNGIVHLSISEEEVKNGMPIDVVLPEHFGPLLELYLETYRPLLETEPTNYLFPGRGARSKDPAGLALQISDCIKERIGLLMHPHLFRHHSATSYLKANPGAYGVVRLLLGHKSIETTIRYYCGTETAAAVRHYDEHILKLREALAPHPIKSRRGVKS